MSDSDLSPLNYDTQPPPSRERRKTFYLVAIPLALILGLGAYAAWNNDEYNLSSSEVSNIATIDIPSDAVNVKSHMNTAHGYIFSLTFTMPPGDLNALLQSVSRDDGNGTPVARSQLFFENASRFVVEAAGQSDEIRRFTLGR